MSTALYPFPDLTVDLLEVYVSQIGKRSTVTFSFLKTDFFLVFDKMVMWTLSLPRRKKLIIFRGKTGKYEMEDLQPIFLMSIYFVLKPPRTFHIAFLSLSFDSLYWFVSWNRMLQICSCWSHLDLFFSVCRVFHRFF